ncbi:hypothetical protein CEUSTIGMA_g9116.t1 [Chlamydomonas eustigma]|uniref:Uncharacterized protein n=1 Tax=Chlamydomonas eustigma TaxID=1157962 RepID=A0A250XF27_9CHLO|nr:hypothetical protein CEUSTIGMA_g9116.t1 [Chlamydomonas eustigma]|eukprot:GAX81688.1 hypothetical protein CEUSTIGMA_g9116.t1 [Chlamydomonas eustigma]
MNIAQNIINLVFTASSVVVAIAWVGCQFFIVLAKRCSGAKEQKETRRETVGSLNGLAQERRPDESVPCLSSTATTTARPVTNDSANLSMPAADSFSASTTIMTTLPHKCCSPYSLAVMNSGEPPWVNCRKNSKGDIQQTAEHDLSSLQDNHRCLEASCISEETLSAKSIAQLSVLKGSSQLLKDLDSITQQQKGASLNCDDSGFWCELAVQLYWMGYARTQILVAGCGSECAVGSSCGSREKSYFQLLVHNELTCQWVVARLKGHEVTCEWMIENLEVSNEQQAQHRRFSWDSNTSSISSSISSSTTLPCSFASAADPCQYSSEALSSLLLESEPSVDAHEDVSRDLGETSSYLH